MNVKVSVIIPVYNTAKYLKECLDSVIKQDFRDFEMIIVDDGSTDDSGKICDIYAAADKRIRVVHRENGGLSAARNDGIELAQGEYLCFIDSDDYISADYLSILYENAVRYKADVSWCSYIRFNECDIPTQRITDNITVKRTKPELWDMLTTIGPDCSSTGFVIAWNKLIRTEKVKGLSFPKRRWHEDEFFVHRLLSVCDSFIETSAQLYYYRKREDSIVGQNNQTDLRHLDVLDAFEERISYAEKYADEQCCRKMAEAYRGTIIILYDTFEKNSPNVRIKMKLRFIKSLFRYKTQKEYIKSYLIFIFNAKLYYRRYWNRL